MHQLINTLFVDWSKNKVPRVLIKKRKKTHSKMAQKLLQNNGVCYRSLVCMPREALEWFVSCLNALRSKQKKFYFSGT